MSLEGSFVGAGGSGASETQWKILLCVPCHTTCAINSPRVCFVFHSAPACPRLKHYRFLRPAAAKRSVAKALRFVQLLPRQYADARTYNMLLKVGGLRDGMVVRLAGRWAAGV